MLPTSAGVEPATSWSPVGRRIQLSHLGRLCLLCCFTVVFVNPVYCPFDITWEDIFFAWHFILNENILFSLTISYQKPFVFSVSVFCSQICTLKFNLQWKIGLIYAISIVKWFFGFFFFSEDFFTFLHWIWIIDVLQYYCENFRKIEPAELQVTYPTAFCIIHIHFYHGEKRKIIV